jgi:hypothetical protein
MTTTQEGGFRHFASILPFLQLLLALCMLGLVIWKPYVLKDVLQWLGPSTLEYFRNPTLYWLALGQMPLLIVWLAAAKPRTLWQWLTAALAVGLTVVSFLVTNDPPSFLG